MEDARYNALMDRVDRWTKLLGTVLIKVSFVDEDTGKLVKETEPGRVHLDVLHGGVYDVKYGASPYYITDLLIGFGSGFRGFNNTPSGVTPTMGVEADPLVRNVGSISELSTINKIYWRPDKHSVEDEKGNRYEVDNPYGVIPAVPFFNADPAHYYFLPINEPLVYANHATNMRLSDLNHIAKFQSFGIPVLKGVERPTSLRQGRPVDDFNQLKGGLAQSRFGGFAGIGGSSSAQGGSFRNFDSGFGGFRDGNADSNALGFSLGPDSAIAVGEKGDFKFAHPNADITGLVKTINSMTDMIRINHGLKPKFIQQTSASGFAMMIEKMGVIEENIRRGRLFKEREQQLFQVIKALWNTHYTKSGEKKFSEKATLEITYKQPEFPVDPKTNIETLIMEGKLLDTGDIYTIRKLYPHLSDSDINKLIKERREYRKEQAIFEAELQAEIAEVQMEASLGKEESSDASSKQNKMKFLRSELDDTTGQKVYIYENEDGKERKVKSKSQLKVKDSIDNKAKHSAQSSVQPKKNKDTRGA